ncbi:MAG: GntR family transcriptional regulator [Bacteroidales bacterium]|nr:GntR family transcriptional regulator [Bacteroidales bacterium]
MEIKINSRAKHSIYKQIVEQVERGVRDGSLLPGDRLPSMNELADRYKISRETVKNAYGILVEKSIIEPRHGKGFYVKELSSDVRTKVLVIFDKLSVYKEILLDSLTSHLGQDAEITILNHDQNIDLLEYYLDTHLDSFDYYVIAPHFPRKDAEQQKRIVKLLERVPVRKLIMIDNLQSGMNGHFGAVYQDFDNDIHDCFEKNIDASDKVQRLRVITLATSMYGPRISKSIERFAAERFIQAECMLGVPDDIERGDTFVLLNSSLDAGIVELSRKIKEKGLMVGRDVRIISYNEYPMNELILGGLTTVSTDFPEMGRITAEMIRSHKLEKVRNPFRMTRRKSF